MQSFNPSSNEDFMKIIVRALMLCTTIAIHTDTTSTWDRIPDVWKEAEYQVQYEEVIKSQLKSRYPTIEKHAPDAIKKFCEKYKDCPACDIMEKMFWCTEKQVKIK